jgi:hypothetical protein
MSEEQQHPQEPAEGGEEDVHAPGAERAGGDQGDQGGASDQTWPSRHPQEPAEGGEEKVEAPGAERAEDGG